MTTIILVVGAILLFILLLLKYYPAFGGKLSKEERRALNQSSNFSNGKFVNQIPTSMNTGFITTLSILRDFMGRNPKRRPDRPIPMETFDSLFIQGNKQAKITWFGHSAFLLELDGKSLLFDPMFGRSPSPFPLVGGKRYSGDLPLNVEELPVIDAVFLSHDHYDHLDYGSIKKLKDKVKRFFVPLGVSKHLERWGVNQEIIKEHDWWSEFEWEGLTLACTPARHFSGRSLSDRNSTLWCSWVVIGKQSKVYFSGDSGYGPHFKEIGETYGPFDYTLMECGQYDNRWSSIHMMPEETVQAHLDVKGDIMIPIHWASFTLALHDWTDPIERVKKEALEKDIAISTPKIGEAVMIGSVEYPKSTWWRS
ncbi:L-ascorbate metabolism protein UlaG (beta-lactamase superfamily) [Bacillus fengqiuensis]|nr:L-ascorbate metabolism protein UlaG (beta-lactamase superfamily) [Bacillus fengqiuensis]